MTIKVQLKREVNGVMQQVNPITSEECVILGDGKKLNEVIDFATTAEDFVDETIVIEENLVDRVESIENRIVSEFEEQNSQITTGLSNIKTIEQNISNKVDTEVAKVNAQLSQLEKQIANARGGNGVSINVKDCGAIGNRVFDNTQILQELCDVAKSAGQLELIFEDGEYLTKELLIYPNTKFTLSNNAKIVRHPESYMLFCNLNANLGVEYTRYNAGYFELTGGYLDGNWNEADEVGTYKGETGAFGHLSRFMLKDTIIIDGANGDHVFDICGCDNVTFDNVEFRGVHGASNPTEVIQIDSMVNGAFPAGGSYDGTQTQNVVIQNCKFIPNPNNSKSKMMCPIGSHTSKIENPYKNIKIINNYFKDVVGNNLNNGIAFQSCYGAEIINNTFDYTDITLKSNIIDFYLQDTNSAHPFENIVITDNVFKMTNCEITDKNAIRVYTNKNRAFRNDKIVISNNKCGELNIHVVASNNVTINNNNFRLFEGGWLNSAKVTDNNFNQIYCQETQNLLFQKNTLNALSDNYQFYRNNGNNINLQILDNTFDAQDFSGVNALKWIKSNGIKVNDNTFVNCEVIWDNDWNNMTSTDVEFKNNNSNVAKNVQISRSTGLVVVENNTNAKIKITGKNVKCINNISDYLEASGSESVLVSNNTINGGRMVFSNTPSLNVNNNVLTNCTANNTGISINGCNGSVSNNVFVTTDEISTYANYCIVVNEASNVITSNNDTRKAKVNTAYVNNNNEGIVIHRSLNKKIFMLKVNTSNQLEMTELTV